MESTSEPGDEAAWDASHRRSLWRDTALTVPLVWPGVVCFLQGQGPPQPSPRLTRMFEQMGNASSRAQSVALRDGALGTGVAVRRWVVSGVVPAGTRTGPCNGAPVR